MRMWFTSTPREYDAGIITFGHDITPEQIIPPNAKNFTTTALLTDECTKAVSCIVKMVFCIIIFLKSTVTS